MAGIHEIISYYKADRMTLMNIDYYRYNMENELTIVASYYDILPMSSVIRRYMPEGFQAVKTIGIPSEAGILHIRVIVEPIPRSE